MQTIKFILVFFKERMFIGIFNHSVWDSDHKKQKGFSIIEMLIAISIMGILIALVVTGFPDLLARRNLDQATQNSITMLEQARARTLSSRETAIGSNEGSSYGVFFDNINQEIILFSGSGYASENVIKTINVGRNIAITTDFGDVASFHRLTGEARATGIITITEARSGAQQTISILSSGLVQ